MSIQLNYRQIVLKELHDAWLKNPDEPVEPAIERVKKVMEVHELKFRQPTDIDLDFLLLNVGDIPGDFFNRANSPKYNKFGWFEWLCETYMDFEPVTRKTNEQLFQQASDKTYGVAAIAERSGNVTIITPVTEDLAKAS